MLTTGELGWKNKVILFSDKLTLKKPANKGQRNPTCPSDILEGNYLAHAGGPTSAHQSSLPIPITHKWDDSRENEGGDMFKSHPGMELQCSQGAQSGVSTEKCMQVPLFYL